MTSQPNPAPNLSGTLSGTLRDLDESWIAYLYREGPGPVAARGGALPARTGIPARLAVYALRLVRRTARRPNAPLPPADVLLYAESANQYHSLAPLVAPLADLGLRCCMICPAHRRSEITADVPITTLTPGPRDALLGAGLALRALPGLLRRLRDRPGAAAHFLDRYLEPWRIAPVLYRSLQQVAPRLVVMSNDHVEGCRTLRHLAGKAGIPTAYLQHAQISPLFPPLEFDHALLDGTAAAAVYGAIAARSGHKLPPVYLGGEKRTPRRVQDGPRPARIGLALSPHDDADKVRSLLHALRAQDSTAVVIRLHPGIQGAARTAIAQAVKDLPAVEVTGARDEPIGDFMARIGVLIAGDSSIHVDAALSDLPSFHAVLHDIAAMQDYYGFKASGLTRPLPDPPHDLLAKAEQSLADNPALRAISETTGTAWQGHEARLSAATLAAILTRDETALRALYPRCDTDADGATRHRL